MSRILLKDIENASLRIAPYIHQTPVLTCSAINELSGRELYFKVEAFQKTGSFKARGACNAVLALKEKHSSLSGVVTQSSGNHGQAVAYASKVAGLPCSVVVPRGSSPVKVEAIRNYGAEVIFCEPTPTSRNETCARIAAETGRLIVHPFDDWNVMAGQGTIALELHKQVPNLEAIVVPISGGGMTSGIAIATKELRAECKVFAAEPTGKDLEKSLRAGEPVWPDPPRYLDTVADALRLQRVGELTFPVLRDLVEKDVLSVDDDEAVRAMKLVWERMKVVVEPASGVGVAAALSPKIPPEVRRIGIILCGGNVDLDHLPWLSTH